MHHRRPGFFGGLQRTGWSVATGTGKIVVHNDAFSFLRGELVRAAAFGWTANGIVETPEGETLRYHAIQKIVRTPSGKIQEIGKIQLH